MADVARSRLPKQIAPVTVDETHVLPSLMANDFEEYLRRVLKMAGQDLPQSCTLSKVNQQSTPWSSCSRPASRDWQQACPQTSKASASSMPWRLMTPKMPKDALRALDALKDACNKQGLTWRGGLAVPCRVWYEAHMAKPRMGSARRSLSEATDDMRPRPRESGDYSGVSVVKAPLRARISTHKTPSRS